MELTSGLFDAETGKAHNVYEYNVGDEITINAPCGVGQQIYVVRQEDGERYFKLERTIKPE